MLDGGDEIAYDRLIVATGAANNYFGNDAWAAHAPSLKTLEDAYEIRRRVLLAFEHAERETDAAQARRAADLRRHRRRRHRRGTGGRVRRDRAPHPERRIPPLRPAQRARGAGRRQRPRAADLSAGPFRAGAAAARAPGRDGLAGPARHRHRRRGRADGSDRLAAQTVVWAAGVAASPLGARLGVPLDARGSRARRRRPLGARPSGSHGHRRSRGAALAQAAGARHRARGEADGSPCRLEYPE